MILRQQEIYTISQDRIKDASANTDSFNFNINSLEENKEYDKIEKAYTSPEFQIKLREQILLYSTVLNKSYQITISQPAVYVSRDKNGKESVYYNSKLMEYNKKYEIEWEGERWALRKTEKEIEFLKWEEESSGK
jgi:hypothetical protein